MRRSSVGGWTRIGQSVAGAALVAAVSARAVHAQSKSASDIYLDKCSVCHGADGAGKTARGKKLKVKDVRETAPKLTSEQMMEVVAKGKAPGMYGYGKEFTAEQIRQIVEHYRSLAKK